MKKRGWIRIVEAFIAILLITGVLLVVINQGYIGRKDISSKVYDAELAILREIQLNEEYRTAILSAGIPVSSDEGSFPSDVKTKIEEKTPNYLECKAKICEIDIICVLDEYNLEKDVYAQSVAITATSETYNPRQLKIFCWSK